MSNELSDDDETGRIRDNRPGIMKTVRFQKVVESSGKPEPHLVLVAPAKDSELQRAIKSGRLMTVFQASVGQKTDHGEIGFHAGPSRQFLIFPKAVARFEGRRVVGIKYDLLDVPRASRREKPVAEKKRPKAASRRRTTANVPEKHAVGTSKIVEFPHPSSSPEDDDETREIKKQVRKAMDALKRGKQVAAFDLLRKIVDE